MRVFIAIEAPEEVKKNIIEFQKELKKTGIFLGNWTKAYHFTLKFLGEVSEEKVEIIKKLQFKTKEFELEAKGLGAFPSEKFINVIWIGSGEGTKQLKSLQEEIEDKLEPLGFEKDSREFGGHLTLCRVKKVYPSQAKDIFAKYKSKTFGKFKVKSIKLLESKLTPSGPIYETIKEFIFS